jgi:ABC-type multidrug transport system fused ATPase/permease subunit
MKEIKRLLLEVRPLYKYLAVILLLAVGRTLIGLADPWIYSEIINFLTYRELGPVFDRILPDAGQMMTLVYLAVLFFGFDSLRTIWVNFSTYYSVFFTTKSRDTISRKVLAKLHSLSVGYFENVKPGMLQERIMSGTRAISSLSQSTLTDIIPIILQFVVGVGVLAHFNLWLSLALVLAIPVYVGLGYWRAKLAKKFEEKIRDAFEERHSVYVENINYQQLIKEYGREQFEQKRFDKAMRYAFDLQLKQQKMRRLFTVAQEIVVNAGYAWTLGFGGYLVFGGQLRIGDVVLASTYLNSVIFRVGEVMTTLENIQLDFVSAKRLFELIDHKDSVGDLDSAGNLKAVKGEIEFRNVSFDYRGNDNISSRNVLRNFNLKIKAGETVALVGPSGIGKSTIIKLLLRFYDPVKGEVLVDGHNVRDITQSSLRQNISSIMQDVLVLNQKIKYNIGYGRPTAKFKEIESASKAANMWTFVNSLKDKFNTVVGERGVKLSGGEKQRLGIARALLKDAPILVMDEATSALDSENEEQVQKALWELTKGRTTIIIAHRLSTVKRADRIIVLGKGKVLEEGTHAQLLKKPKSYYKKLYKMQGVLLRG